MTEGGRRVFEKVVIGIGGGWFYRVVIRAIDDNTDDVRKGVAMDNVSQVESGVTSGSIGGDFYYILCFLLHLPWLCW